MSIDREAIKHIEALARIQLGDDEVDAITDQLIRIVGFVEKLQSVDTGNVPPTKLIAHGEGESLRKDVAQEGLPREVVLGQAPAAAAGFFSVPPVIDRGEES